MPSVSTASTNAADLHAQLEALPETVTGEIIGRTFRTQRRPRQGILGVFFGKHRLGMLARYA